MARRIVITSMVVLLTAIVVRWALRPRIPDLIVPKDTQGLADTAQRAMDLRNAVYDRYDAPLWTDRTYHTFQAVRKLADRQWVPVGRNEDRWYALDVQEPTVLYTLANRADLRGVEQWTVLPDTVLVDDSYAPRRFDALLSLEVGPGIYRVRSPKGGPSKPVFFDPHHVRIAHQ